MIAISTVPIVKPISAPAVPPSASHSTGRMNAPQPTAEPNAIANTHAGFIVLSSLRVSACAVASDGAVAGVSDADMAGLQESGGVIGVPPYRHSGWWGRSPPPQVLPQRTHVVPHLEAGGLDL